VKKHLLLVPCLLILAAVALAACGGGGGGSSDEGQIEETIETSATTSDPASCTELETQAFVEQNTGTNGAAAVKECEEEAEEGEETAESVDVSNVSVNGEEATAEVAFTGGSLDSQAVEVGLVKEGDTWKLNEIIAFTEFEAAKLAEALSTKFAEEKEAIPANLATCIVKAFSEASQSEAEELVFSGSSKPIEELAEGCQ
jgi:hypothetical protein